jgi:hypothetical protein
MLAKHAMYNVFQWTCNYIYMSDSKTCIQVYLICHECLFLKHFSYVEWIPNHNQHKTNIQGLTCLYKTISLFS